MRASKWFIDRCSRACSLGLLQLRPDTPGTPLVSEPCCFGGWQQLRGNVKDTTEDETEDVDEDAGDDEATASEHPASTRHLPPEDRGKGQRETGEA